MSSRIFFTAASLYKYFKRLRLAASVLALPLVINLSTIGFKVFALALVVCIFSYKIKLTAKFLSNALRGPAFLSKTFPFFLCLINLSMNHEPAYRQAGYKLFNFLGSPSFLLLFFFGNGPFFLFIFLRFRNFLLHFGFFFFGGFLGCRL